MATTLRVTQQDEDKEAVRLTIEEEKYKAMSAEARNIPLQCISRLLSGQGIDGEF